MQPESLNDLERLHRTYRPALIRYFSRRTGSHAEAEDLTQELFIRLANSRTRTVTSAEAFLFQVAANLIRDRARREKVRADYRAAIQSIEGVGIDPFDPHRIAVSRDAIEALHQAIADLPEKTRRIFVLYRLENIDKQTIADSFHLSRSSVDKHISRALALLIDRMGTPE